MGPVHKPELVQGGDSNFYGTTFSGGTSSNGTVFRITPSGAETNLYSFGSQPNDGNSPFAELVQGSDSNFYGTTFFGGTSTNCFGGCGTVFRITPSGAETNLYSFVGPPNDGANPGAGLVQGSDSNFYGTTEQGGANGLGTVFRISPSGAETNLYSFGSQPNDGTDPFAVLVQGSDSNFYGTTSGGGTNGAGTVFKLTLCDFSIDHTNAAFTAAGGSDSVSVTTSNGCAWTASTTNSWITITAGSSGTGNGTVSYSVAANASSSVLTGTVTIAGQRFTVTEGGIACTFLIDPTNGVFTAAGGVGGVSVTAPNGCAWTAISNSGFITITAGSSGSGNGSVSYSVATNANATIQTGTMTIAGQTFTVTEAAAACNVSPASTNASFSAAGGSSSVVITANGTNCSWTAVSNSGFITITAGSSGSGNGSVSYTVAINSNTTIQTGSMTIAGQTFTVTQAALACNVSPASTNASFSAAGGSSSVVITANGTNCSWTAVSNSGFIMITAGSSGSGNGSVSYTVAANSNTTIQTGTMTIAGQVFTVTEAAAACNVSPASTNASFSAAGGSSNVVITANGTNCSWTAVSNSGFITITAGSSGSGNGSVSYTVATNANATIQTGSMTIAGQTFTVTEAAAACNVSPTSTNASFSAAGGSSNVVITANGTNCSWTAVSNSDFITITAGGSGSGNGSVSYTVAANTNMTTLIGTMTIAGQTFTVTQAALPCSVSPTSTSASFSAAGGSSNIVITANGTSCSWTAVSDSGFITITAGSSGSGNGSVSYAVAANTNATIQIGTMIIAGQTFTVTQAGGVSPNCRLTLSATSINLPAKGGTKTVKLKAKGTDCAWTAISNDSFIRIISGSSGTGNGKVRYTVPGNTNTTALSGTMTIAGQTFTVNQAAGGCTFSLSPKDGNFQAAGGPAAVQVKPNLGDCAWTAVSNDAFIKIVGNTNGVGRGTVGYFVSANTNTTTLTGSITIAGETFTITESGAP